MKHNHLKTAVLLGLAMSITTYSAGMAAGREITRQENLQLSDGDKIEESTSTGYAKGIYIHGKGAKLTLTTNGPDDEIWIKANADSNAAYALDVRSKGTADFNVQGTIHMQANGGEKQTDDTSGIKTYGNENVVNIGASKNIDISAISEKDKRGKFGATGVDNSQYSDVQLSAGGDISIIASGVGSTFGVRVGGQETAPAKNTDTMIQAGGNVTIQASMTDGNGTNLNNSAAGIYVQGAESTDYKQGTSINGKRVSITADGEFTNTGGHNTANTYGIYLATGNKVSVQTTDAAVESSENPTLVIGSSLSNTYSPSTNGAYGIKAFNANQQDNLLEIINKNGATCIFGKGENGVGGYGISLTKTLSTYKGASTASIDSKKGTTVFGTTSAVVLDDSSALEVTAEEGDNLFYSTDGPAISITGGKGFSTTAEGYENIVHSKNGTGLSIKNSTAALTAAGNRFFAGEESYGITADNSTVTLIAHGGQNTIQSGTITGTPTGNPNGSPIGIQAKNGSAVTLYKTGAADESGTANSVFSSDKALDAFGDGTKIILGAEAGNNLVSGSGLMAISASGAETQVQMKTKSGDNLVFNNYAAGNGISVSENADVSMMTRLGDNSMTGSGYYGTYLMNGSLTMNSGKGDNTISVLNASGTGIYSVGGTASLYTAEGDNTVQSTGYYGAYLTNGSLTMNSGKGDNTISVFNNALGIGIRSVGSTASLYTAEGNNTVQSSGNGILIQSGGAAELIAGAGDNSVTADSGYAIFASGAAGDSTKISLDADSDNAVNGKTWGIAASQGQVELSAKGNNQVSGTDNDGIYTYDNASVALTAGADNFVAAGTITDNFGSKYALKGLSGSTIQLSAANQNGISGAVYASGAAGDTATQIGLTGGSNVIYSAAVISDAGDLNTSGNADMSGKQVISALYAEDGADITVSGQNNTFRTTADPNNPDQLERVIWAYNGADINIDGTTLISTDSYKESPNSADIAIAAGTAVGISAGTDFNTPVNRSEVNLNYGAGSSITGDVIAGYAGEVNVSRALDAGDAGIQVEGNLLAGNNGILNVDLGNGGTLTGRADDYGDAGVIKDSEHTTFFDPAFSSGIYKGGAVNLTMGEGSRWNVTGQSWITRIDTTEAGSAEDSGRAVIDLVSANTERNTYAHALTVYEMKGDAVFNMSLDGDRDVSDMLYMKHADGSYIINVYDPVTTDDMYAGNFNGLRFATVGDGSKVSFRAVTVDQGALDVEYEVGTDAYNGNPENGAYNSADGSGDGNEEKPGNEMVDGFFESTGTPVDENMESGTMMSRAMVLATEDEEAGSQLDNVQGTTNYKLIAIKETHISNAGQTVIDMSKVNYSNAVYMDRLNKRMGEARYIEGDDGPWVRLRHDRIGREDAFRSMNTMFELGYDRKVQDQKYGEHRRGVAFDYMRGEADYTNVMGSGDVRRAGVWLYDTWLGDKGHYSDYVLKYGRLSNDFDIFAPTTGDKISGDYDNDVWSASAEYGRKKDIGNEWYFEPQAQLQYAYVTSADYTTSQNTKVSLDGIDSLIGRAGFRLGRDTSEGNTVYFKADILHEFLGDQSIRAMDGTGVLSTTYDNEGTWYDVGFGFSHRMGEDSYMFLDVEHSFGNDNEDTYQINIGLNRAF